MEFQNVGHHCQYPGCNIHDFLPFFCQACQKYYCLEHREYVKHECPNNPLLKKTLKPKKERTEIIKYKCSHPGCKNNNKVAIHCLKCNKNFCLKHRFPDTHNCSSLDRDNKNYKNNLKSTNKNNKPSNTKTNKKSNIFFNRFPVNMSNIILRNKRF